MLNAPSRYTVEQELGSGAFGTVYSARDAQSGQLVALKQLSRLSPAALSRFKQEFRAVQGLNHPHIVRLDALIEHDSGWLIAMELVEGDDLLTYVKQSDNDPTFDEAKLRAARISETVRPGPAGRGGMNHAIGS